MAEKTESSNVTKAGTDKTVYRLLNMVTKEVSLVDRAAIRRKFLVVKREGQVQPMGIGSELVQNADGSFSKAGPPPPAATPPAQPPSAAATPAAPAEGEKPQAPQKVSLALTQDVKLALSQTIGDAVGMLTAAKSAVDSASQVTSEAEMDFGPLIDMLGSSCEGLEDILMALMQGEEEGEPPPPATDAQPAPVVPPPPAPPMGKRLAVIKAQRVLAGAAIEKTAQTILAKVGRKMSKARAERLKQAFSMIGDLLREVDFGDVLKAGMVPGTVAPAATSAAPAVPPKKKPEMPEPAAVAPAQKELQKRLDSMQAQLDARDAELALLRKGASPSNAAPPPQAVTKSATNQTTVSWPSDMNAKAR